MILLVGLAIIHTRPTTVYADGMTVSGGDYILTVGAIVENDEEYVFVIDVPSEKMLAYRFDTGRGRIEIVHGIDLAKIREAAEQQTPANQPRGRRRP